MRSPWIARKSSEGSPSHPSHRTPQRSARVSPHGRKTPPARRGSSSPHLSLIAQTDRRALLGLGCPFRNVCREQTTHSVTAKELNVIASSLRTECE